MIESTLHNGGVDGMGKWMFERIVSTGQLWDAMSPFMKYRRALSFPDR